MVRDVMQRNGELHRIRKEDGWSFPRLAAHFGISVGRARQIYDREDQRLSHWAEWPDYRRRLSYRAQQAILYRFEGDETVFLHPARIAAETGAQELLRYKNTGKVTVAEIVASLVALRIRLGPQWQDLKVRW